MDKRSQRLEALFTEKFLKHSCFNSIKELEEDKTPYQINAVRALIACNLSGAWQGFQLGYSLAIADTVSTQTHGRTHA